MIDNQENCSPAQILSSPSTKRSKTECNNSASTSFHVEIRVKKGIATSSAREKLAEIEAAVNSNHNIYNWKSFQLEQNALKELVVSLSVGSCSLEDGSLLSFDKNGIVLTDYNTHFYHPNNDGSLAQEISVDGNSDESTVGSQLWNLPCIEFEHIWENLFYDSNLKNEVLSYIQALVLLSDRGTNMNIISVNRIVLLLGPPGTGKTSLCRGLAQHLSIRLNSRYRRSVMVEINSHSLFSKWFSESGKLVLKMFDQIDEIAEDTKCLVFVLIDEVESLGMARESSSDRGDPADSIRAVNALLTQIDRIRRRENVVILCTSNLEKCLDSALLDRADLIRHVGTPSRRALYSIFSECIQELQRVGIVDDTVKLKKSPLGQSEFHFEKLWNLTEKAQGLSGRATRQIPALACSKSFEERMSLENCIDFFEQAIEDKLKKTTM